MKKGTLFLIYVLQIITLGNTACFSQTLRGRVLDENGRPISAVTIVIQKLDSTEAKADITKSDGTFFFQDAPQKYRLVASHLSYGTKIFTDTVAYKVIYMQEKSNSIEDVTITAPVRQITLGENGALLFDAKAVAKTHPSTNIMDLIEGISVIQKTGDEYTLIGTSSTSIMINGRKSSLTQEQIKSMLLSMSPDRAKNIEIFYNTPAKYGMKGATINVNLVEKKTEQVLISGEGSLNCIFRHYTSYNGGGNIQLTSKKMSANVGYSLYNAKKKTVLDLVSEHVIGIELFNIVQQTKTDIKCMEHKFYVDFNWNFTKQSNLSLSYTVNFNKPVFEALANTTIGKENVLSNTNNKDKSYLHNMSSVYNYKTFEIGCDVSFYNQKENQTLCYSLTNINGLYKQDFFKMRAYFNNELSLHIGNLQYGMDCSYSTTDNIKQTTNDANDAGSFNSSQKEYNFSFFLGYNMYIGKRGSIDASIQAEYFKSTVDDINVNKAITLWSTFNLYPRLTFMYKLNKMSSVQMVFNSQNFYPSYWITASNRTYINSYCANDGNPHLNPYTKYVWNFNYILCSKYIFGAFYEYCDNYYTQLLIQSTKELIATYKYYNMDSSSKIGVMSVIPIKWSNIINTRLTGMFFSMSQRGDVEDIVFDRNKFSARLMVANTLNLIRNRLVAEVSGWYQFPIIQGLYDVDTMCSVSMGLTWVTGIKGLSFVFKGEDIFNTYRMKVNTCMKSQKYSFMNNVDQRYLSLTVKYNFNDHKLHKSTNTINERIGF